MHDGVCSILSRSRQPSQNITRNQKVALKTQMKKGSIVILSADKRNATAVAECTENEGKRRHLFGDTV